MEIVAYIGGSVVQKLRKQASRLSDENKQKQVVALFFKIRAHNKARKVMQRKVDQKKVLLKEKSLRKRLKKNLPTT
jgi:CRISPR/Cas system-associated endonuclease Cas1